MAQFSGGGLVKCEAPLPNRFLSEDNASLCEKFLDRTES
jgi:hypothetical protein